MIPDIIINKLIQYLTNNDEDIKSIDKLYELYKKGHTIYVKQTTDIFHQVIVYHKFYANGKMVDKKYLVDIHKIIAVIGDMTMINSHKIDSQIFKKSDEIRINWNNIKFKKHNIITLITKWMYQFNNEILYGYTDNYEITIHHKDDEFYIIYSNNYATYSQPIAILCEFYYNQNEFVIDTLTSIQSMNSSLIKKDI